MMKKFQILADGDQRSLEAFGEIANQKSAVALQDFQNLPSSFFTEHHVSRMATLLPQREFRESPPPCPQLIEPSRSAPGFRIFALRRGSTDPAVLPDNWPLRRPPPA